MKTKYILPLVLFCLNTFGQLKEMDSVKLERFKIEGGLLLPQGKLSSKIGVSQLYSFWYRTKLEHDDIMDLGVTFVVPNVKNSFVYKGNDSIFNVKAKAITLMFASRFNKHYPLKFMGKKSQLVWSSTLGVSFFMFEDKENLENESGYYQDENGNHYYRIDTNTKALTCFYLGQGIGLEVNKFCVQVNYNFTPYSWFSKRIESDFGKSSLSVTASYIFR